MGLTTSSPETTASLCAEQQFDTLNVYPIFVSLDANLSPQVYGMAKENSNDVALVWARKTFKNQTGPVVCQQMADLLQEAFVYRPKEKELLSPKQRHTPVLTTARNSKIEATSPLEFDAKEHARVVEDLANTNLILRTHVLNDKNYLIILLTPYLANATQVIGENKFERFGAGEEPAWVPLVTFPREGQNGFIETVRNQIYDALSGYTQNGAKVLQEQAKASVPTKDVAPVLQRMASAAPVAPKRTKTQELLEKAQKNKYSVLGALGLAGAAAGAAGAIGRKTAKPSTRVPVNVAKSQLLLSNARELLVQKDSKVPKATKQKLTALLDKAMTELSRAS